jgi:hypothetical protein
VNNPIAKHLDQMLAERLGDDGKTVAELIAETLVELALGGNTCAIKIIVDAVEAYDAVADSAWDQSEDD